MVTSSVGSAQNSGTKYWDEATGTYMQHDSISVGVVNRDFQSPAEARQYLNDVITDASKRAQQASQVLEARGLDSGSTLTTAMVMPDGHIITANMGDSPLMGFVIDADGNCKQALLMNELHNPNPYKLNGISHDSSLPDSLDGLLNAKGDTFKQKYSLSNLEEGDRFVVVAASDGVLDTIDNASKELNEEAAQKFVDRSIQQKVDDYGELVAKEMRKGASPQDIAQSIVGDAIESGGKDNTSAIAMVLDPKDLPQKPVLLTVADGNGDEGRQISSIVKESFDARIEPLSSLRPAQRKVPVEKIHAASSKPTPDVDSSKTWKHGELEDGSRCMYMETEGLSPQQMDELDLELKSRNIQYTAGEGYITVDSSQMYKTAPWGTTTYDDGALGRFIEVPTGKEARLNAYKQSLENNGISYYTQPYNDGPGKTGTLILVADGDALRTATWVETDKGMYLNASKLSDEKLEAYKNALQSKGFDCELKNSSVFGEESKVLVVNDKDAFDRFRETGTFDSSRTGSFIDNRKITHVSSSNPAPFSVEGHNSFDPKEFQGKSFSETISDFNHKADKNLGELPKNLDSTLRSNFHDVEKVAEIEKSLASKGHTSFEYIGNGKDGIAFRSNTGDVIRIEGDSFQARDKSPFMLKNKGYETINSTHGKIHIEVLDYTPSLHALKQSGAITKEEASALYKRLRVDMAKSNCYSSDLIGTGGAQRLDNVGLLPDGTPVVVDPGSRIESYKGVENHRIFGDPKSTFSRQYNLALETEIPDHIRYRKFSWSKGIASHADDVGDGLSLLNKMRRIKTIGNMFKSARLGTNIPVGGCAIGIGALALSNEVKAEQINAAEELYNNGRISYEALEAYKEMQGDCYGVIIADTAISELDPTGGSIVVTAAADAYTRQRYHEWAHEHAPHLNPIEYDALSVSALGDDGPVEEMLLSADDKMPISMDGQPEYMRGVVEARQNYEAAMRDYQEQVRSAGLGAGGGAVANASSGAAMQRVVDAEAVVVEEMSVLLANPETADAVLSHVSPEQKLKLARILAKSEEDPALFAERYPEIAAYVEEYENSTTKLSLHKDDVLKENPQLLDDYIKSRSDVTAYQRPENFMTLEELKGTLPRELTGDEPKEVAELVKRFNRIDELEAERDNGKVRMPRAERIRQARINHKITIAEDELREYYNGLREEGGLDNVVAYAKGESPEDEQQIMLAEKRESAVQAESENRVDKWVRSGDYADTPINPVIAKDGEEPTTGEVSTCFNTLDEIDRKNAERKPDNQPDKENENTVVVGKNLDNGGVEQTHKFG